MQRTIRTILEKFSLFVEKYTRYIIFYPIQLLGR